MADPLQVEVVSADEVVWSGEATSIIARTVAGDIGLLANHEPLLAVLVPSGVEIVTTSGEREVVAVDGGFVSMANNRVSILSEFAEMASRTSLAQAEAELSDARAAVEALEAAGSVDADSEGRQLGELAQAHKRLHRATAQVKAASKIA